VNARFAKPLDKKSILNLVHNAGMVITVEEAVRVGGFGSIVRDFLDREELYHIRFKSIGIPLEVYPLGKAEQIKKMYRLDKEGLVQEIKRFYEAGLKKNNI